ncbi:hypothetical protein K457DRAFT_1725129 [Linnemannia elongata AG-77]|uniref:Uncharacterized protein n=1 Tax=Linnemannia elongata AG-77 TaxID=1314771 RepID=A0A197JHS7_9FUNG|nr:hypothetical protein K457DRAFT_1725129 [Linnemannia elongata AG-77]
MFENEQIIKRKPGLHLTGQSVADSYFTRRCCCWYGLASVWLGCLVLLFCVRECWLCCCSVVSGEGWGTGEFGQSMMCEWGLVGRMKE